MARRDTRFFHFSFQMLFYRFSLNVPVCVCVCVCVRATYLNQSVLIVCDYILNKSIKHIWTDCLFSLELSDYFLTLLKLLILTYIMTLI